LLNTERWKNFARNAFFCSSDAAYMRARISKSSQMIDTAQRAESSTRANARPRANSRRLINSPWTMAAQLVQLHIAAMDAA
jgi:hypothetical protein